MLQNLLVERFGLKVHHETKDLPIYELSVIKNGTKMKPSMVDPNAPQGLPAGPPPPIGRDGFPQLPSGRKVILTAMTAGHARTSAVGQPVSGLVDRLGNWLSSPVVDKTGLAGLYDYSLDFALEPGHTLGPLGPPVPLPPPGAAPSPALRGAAGDPHEPLAIATALQEQLGLKLDKKRGPVEMLVIDRAEKTPAEN